MSPVETVAPVLPDETPAELAEVGVYATERAAFDHGLVVLALGRPFWTEAGAAGHRLLVEAEVAPRVSEQLARYDRESVDWPPRPIVDESRHGTDLIMPLLWALAMLVIFHLQTTRPGWAKAGAVDSVAIFERGEWWRIGTALGLHGDGAHVISNALSGVFLFTAVLNTFGRVAGWMLLAAAAILGNFSVAALAYPEPYRSLGASTSIFAGLGLLTGRMVGVLRGADRRERGRAMFVALGSGLVVFALYGAGGGAAHVDIGAHVAGFGAGLLIGAVAGRRQLRD